MSEVHRITTNTDLHRSADTAPTKMLIQDWWHTRLTLLLDRPAERIALHRIAIDDRLCCVRQRLASAALIEEMNAQGQREPVVLRYHGGRASLQMIAGFRRVTAAACLGWPTLEAVVLDDVTDQDAFNLAVFDNERRGTLTDLERAYVVARCRDLGFSLDDVATRLFRMSRRQAERLESLLRLPVAIQDAVADAELTTSHALALLQCAARQETGAFDFDGWLRVVAQEQLTVAQLQVRLALTGLVPSSSPLRLEPAGPAGGFRLVTRTGSLQIDQLSPAQREELRCVAQQFLTVLDELEAPPAVPPPLADSAA